MTAIAYKDGVMAADSLCCGGDMRRGEVRKIARSPKGTIGAAAGKAGKTAEFRRWVESGRIDEWIASGCWINAGEIAYGPDGFADKLPIDEELNSFGAIIVTVENRVICLDYRGYRVELDALFYVEGSAEQILMGAMAAGASAEEAVEIAIRYDVGCGGKIQVERV